MIQLQFINQLKFWTREQVEKVFPMDRIPSVDWFSTLYVTDVMLRLDHEILPAITGVCGAFMCMDSTKSVLKKLGGYARNSASWVTNWANTETAQLIKSMVTCSEARVALRLACIEIIQR